MSEHRVDPNQHPLPEDDPRRDPAAEPTDDPADTRPKAPAGLREALAAHEPPVNELADTTPRAPVELRPPARPLLLAVVMVGMACLCLMMIGVTSMAAYRDGLATNDVRNTSTQATELAMQYATGVAELQAGTPGLAAIRFQEMLKTVPADSVYAINSRTQLAVAQQTLQALPMATAAAQQYATGVAALQAGDPAAAAVHFDYIVNTLQAPTAYALDSADLLSTAQAAPVATLAAEQYATGVAALEAGNAAGAAAHFDYIVNTLQAPPAFARDSADLLSTAQAIASYTPPPPSVTATLEAAPVEGLTPTPAAPAAGPNPEELYQRAKSLMMLGRYEDAITWIQALEALAPNYAPDVDAMYLEAVTTLAAQYLRGQNADGEDMLVRGVLLAYEASDLGDSSLLYEADFVERYRIARDYMNGQQYGPALELLRRLCEENCDWSYHGLSVRTMLEQAEAAMAGIQ